MSSYFCRSEFLYSFIALQAAVNFGVIIAIPSETVKQWKELNWEVSSTEYSFWTSAPSLFAIFGPMIATWLLSFMGRRPVQCIFSSCEAVLWFLQICGLFNKYFLHEFHLKLKDLSNKINDSEN